MNAYRGEEVSFSFEKDDDLRFLQIYFDQKNTSLILKSGKVPEYFRIEDFATGERSIKINMTDSKGNILTESWTIQFFEPPEIITIFDEAEEEFGSDGRVTNFRRPKFKIGRVNVIGQVSIKFNQNMYIRENINYTKVFDVSIES